MKSRLASDARQDLNNELRRMTAEQRLGAFVAHCQLIVQLHRAGRAVQQRPRRTVTQRAG
jgi:hypothetical protein